MAKFTIGLANAKMAKSAEESLEITLEMIAEAGERGADIVCFPESYVPGYRSGPAQVDADAAFLENAWTAVDRAAGKAGISVVLGTERFEAGKLHISVRVTNSDGTCAGFQDKVQLDPSEESVYSAGVGRRTFTCGDVTFGVVICHEGWRYPETVRWAARSGAQIVFHPHTEIVEDPSHIPTGFADPNNSFHEKAALCRAAENHCFFATVNNAIPGASTTSAVIGPDGNLLASHPYGQHGVLLAEIDPTQATGFLAKRLRTFVK